MDTRILVPLDGSPLAETALPDALAIARRRGCGLLLLHVVTPDSIERAYAQGIHELEGLVAYLNQSGPSGPNGQPWTPESYQQEMARLGA